jgi:hypothetical protein
VLEAHHDSKFFTILHDDERKEVRRVDLKRFAEVVVRWGAILIPRLTIGAGALLVMMVVYESTGSKPMVWSVFGSFFLMMVGLEILVDSFGRSPKPPGGPPVGRV